MTKKGNEKSPAVPRQRTPAKGGHAPLGTPKLWSKNPKAKKCRNDCIFLNAFGPFSILTPSGPKFLYILTVGADSISARHAMNVVEDVGASQRPFAWSCTLRATDGRPYTPYKMVP